MKDIIEQVIAKTGISPDQAQGAVAAVLDFLKGKLPGPIADQLTKFASGEAGSEAEGGSSNPLDAAKDMLGGFFKKE